jgi:hypothetical protein
MAFTTTEVNGWFQTIDGLPPTTASIPSSLATQYVGELNAGTATPGVIQAELENFVAPPIPPPFTDTSLFYRTSVAQFVLREFQAAWGTVPSTGPGSQFDNWVARIIANPSLEGGGMSQTLAGTPQFMAEYGTTSATQPATLAFITQLAANLQVAVGPGAMANVGLPVWQVLQNFVTSPTVITSLEGPIANFQNLLLAGAVPGGSIFDLPPPTQALTLTPGLDTPTTGFTSGNGATATTAGSVFNALPVAGTLGLNNTLNTGDNLQATDAAAGASTLNVTDVLATDGLLANPPFALGVTTNGVSTLNISNLATVLGIPVNGGFQGNITGLTTVNNNNSVAEVQLGGTGQGLKTLLTNYNINDYAGPAGNAFLNIIAAGAADLTQTINVGITGTLGNTTPGGASQITFSNDSGAPGTAAAANNTYGTWAITYDSNTFAELNQGAVRGVSDVGGATALTLTGANAAATFAAGTDFAGNWQLLTSIDETATAGRVIITGATAGNDTNFLASAANPGWLFGSNAGLLDDTGAGFALTSVKLGSGLDVLDISSATAAQVAALTTGAGTGVTVNPGNIIIVQDSVATTGSATTFANIAGFSTLGIGGPTAAQGAAGTINMANLPASINTLLYVTQAAGSVTVNNGVNNLTVNVNHNTEAGAITTLGINDASTTSTTDTMTLILGDTVGTVGGIAGGNIAFTGVAPDFGGAINGLATTGYANVDIVSNGPAGQANILSGDSQANVFTANAGALETLTISGTTELINNAIFVDGIGGTGVITDNDTSVTQIFAFGTNAAFTPSGPNFIATNAAVINAGGSGGLLMGGSDVQFGAIITGSATGNNVLAGSVGNDTFGGGSGTDLVITDNGGDTVNLAGTHTAATVDLFFGNFVGNNGGFDGTAAGTFANVTGLANSYISANDVANAGTWGVAPAVNAAGTPTPNAGNLTPLQLFAHNGATNNGTSADMTSVNNFHAGSDVVDLSVTSNSNAGLGNGWVHIGNNTFLNPAGEATQLATVPAGQTVPNNTNVVELSGFFANANAVALALGNNTASGGGTYDLRVTTSVAFNDHFLVAYQDTAGSTRLADVDIGPGASHNSTAHAVVASDMVDLVGVPLTSFSAANVHWVA